MNVAAPKPTPKPPAPRLVYKTGVDPTFTQSTSNPLAVTYAYDASAFAGAVNLGATGQLPAGVLNFYSQTRTGSGPQSLFCSMNVGGFVTGGSCPITYGQTGTFSVTTEYIPDAASAVTQTVSETIPPFTTTTVETLTPITCPPSSPGAAYPENCYTFSVAVTDQAGGAMTGTVFVTATGASQPRSTTVPIGQSCTLEVYYDGGRTIVNSPDCNTVSADMDFIAPGQDVTAWTLTATYQQPPVGWAPSSSTPVTATP